METRSRFAMISGHAATGPAHAQADALDRDPFIAVPAQDQICSRRSSWESTATKVPYGSFGIVVFHLPKRVHARNGLRIGGRSPSRGSRASGSTGVHLHPHDRGRPGNVLGRVQRPSGDPWSEPGLDAVGKALDPLPLQAWIAYPFISAARRKSQQIPTKIYLFRVRVNEYGDKWRQVFGRAQR